MIGRMDLADLGRRLALRQRPRSWNGDCPACSYRGAFSMKPGRCGAVRAYCANGCTPDVLDAALTRTLGTDWRPPARLVDADIDTQRAAKQAAAARLFNGSTPLTRTDPAGLYMARRGLAGFTGCPSLRYRGDCRHQDGGRLPALVAEVTNAAGQPIAVHRTYLDRKGRKADVDPCKMTLGPMWGGAVRLTLDLAPPPALVVGEGVESSASAGLLLRLPAWAALSAGNLGGGLVLPDDGARRHHRSRRRPVGQREANRRPGAGGRRAAPCGSSCPIAPARTSTTFLLPASRSPVHAG